MGNRKKKNRKYDATNYDMARKPGSVFTELLFLNARYYRGGFFCYLRNRKAYKIGQSLKNKLPGGLIFKSLIPFISKSYKITNPLQISVRKIGHQRQRLAQ